jgi:DNA-directed RNA polymerase subunit RPC12/RpoP
MTGPAFAEHSAIRTAVPLPLPDGTVVPAGLEGYVVDVVAAAQRPEAEYTVEVVIADANGVQVDGLLHARESELVSVLSAGVATPVRRLSETYTCGDCGRSVSVVWERPPMFAMGVTQPVACPQCGAVNDDMALGAIRPPLVTIAQGRSRA